MNTHVDFVFKNRSWRLWRIKTGRFVTFVVTNLSTQHSQTTIKRSSQLEVGHQWCGGQTRLTCSVNNHQMRSRPAHHQWQSHTDCTVHSVSGSRSYTAYKKLFEFSWVRKSRDDEEPFFVFPRFGLRICLTCWWKQFIFAKRVWVTKETSKKIKRNA